MRAGGVVVVHSPCTNASGVQFSLRAVVYQSMLALAGFLRDIRFPPVFKYWNVVLYVCIVICLNVELLALIKLLPTNCIVSV